MKTIEKLVEQHIREYESRLRHIDELLEQAKINSSHLDDSHQVHSQLKAFGEQHEDLASEGENIKKKPLSNWREEMIQTSGPMALLDILGQKLEDVIERLDRK